jgi:hypothetical protein
MAMSACAVRQPSSGLEALPRRGDSLDPESADTAPKPIRNLAEFVEFYARRARQLSLRLA